jgi:rod shape-determining protein MreD
MTKDLFFNIIRFILLLFAQVFVFNKFNLGGYFNPMVYPLFILLLPFEIPGALLLFVSFSMGLSVDLFVGSVGLHASAATFMAFMRPLSLRLIHSSRDYETGLKPGINDLGYNWFVSYTLFLVLAHHLFYFSVESFDFSEIGSIILRTLVSTIFSVLVIVMVDIVFKPQPKRK